MSGETSARIARIAGRGLTHPADLTLDDITAVCGSVLRQFEAGEKTALVDNTLVPLFGLPADEVVKEPPVKVPGPSDVRIQAVAEMMYEVMPAEPGAIKLPWGLLKSAARKALRAAARQVLEDLARG